MRVNKKCKQLNRLVSLLLMLLLFILANSLVYAESTEIKNTNLYSITGSKSIASIFPDKNLATVVAKTLGYGTNTTIKVDQKKLNSITILSADSVEVSSIEGIQHLSNATKISFQNSLNIFDLSPLINANLPNLKILYFKGNKIEDLSPLAQVGLENLEELYVDDNLITSLTGLENLKNLKILSFENTKQSGNTVDSLQPISTLVKLNIIYGKNNKLTELKPLKDLSKLTELYLESNQLTSISGLENKLNFKKLSLMYQNIEDLTPISESTLIEELYIRENNIKSIAPLKKMTNLKTLLMENNHVTNISSLTNINTLTLFSATDQTQVLSKKNYSPLVLFELENTIKTIDDELVNPFSISDNGEYTEPTIQWFLPTGQKSVSYSWETQNTLPGSFSGIITQPLEEVIHTDLTIKNKIENHPNPNEEITYEIQMLTEEGLVVSPEKNGLEISEKDPTFGKFSLKNEEIITIKGVQNASYKIIEEIDSKDFNAFYSSVHDSESLINKVLPENKTITGNLGEYNNIEFVNKYKEVLKISNEFTINGTENKAVYDILFTYPDGTTSGSTYSNIIIEESKPIEETFEIGTTYEISQKEISGYESSVTVVENGIKKPIKYGQIHDNLTSTGTIGTAANTVHFKNTKLEQLKISNKDLSKHVDTNQIFNYIFDIAKPDNSGRSTYELEKYRNDILIESSELEFGKPISNINIKNEEYVIMKEIPVETTYSIEQKGVLDYTTKATDSSNSGLINDGEISKGAIVNGNMVVNGNTIDFTNRTEGKIELISAPNTINFGTIAYDATIKRVDDGIYDQELIINDTRSIKSKWTLGAKLISQMTNTDDESIKLVDSLQYVNGDKTVILSEDLQGIYQSADKP
ncbi:MAG: leucine-rich repeat domain-containing protein, partial [Vagococcus fluvialis]